MRTIPTFHEGSINFGLRFPFESENAGLFVSRGFGHHPDRIISSFEIIYVVKGSLLLREEEKEYRITIGRYLILVPGLRHWGPEEYPPDLEFYWLHFRSAPGAPEALFSPAGMPREGFVSEGGRLVELFRWFLDAQEKGELDKGLADMLCSMILVVAGRRPDSMKESDERVAMLAREARRAVKKSCQERLSTSILAERLTCNPDYLGRIYKRSYGLSILEDIHAQRIKLAKKLLLDDNLNVNEVALRCGYAEATYFRRIFKRREGLSPGKFRRMYSHLHMNSD
ncbi:MAG: AraC family transcriptional regulator [Spirochaetaceae bacterium]|nr:AraC family transcriptional regulator [Spirochaetaceae bacterium]